MWERRFDQFVVSDEPEMQWDRLRYVLSHGVKENLVESPIDWLGVHSAAALVHGEPLEGWWFNRTKEMAARARGLEFGPYDFATRYLINFSQLPAFWDLSPEEYQDKVAELIWEIEAKGREARGEGNSVAGVEHVLGLNPYERPTTKKPKRSSGKPVFFAKDRLRKEAMKDDLKAFLEHYLQGSEALRNGPQPEVASLFPVGCYPPALPFTGSPAPPRPPAPPTRSLKIVKSKVVERGEIPVVEVGGRGERKEVDPRARGQPP